MLTLVKSHVIESVDLSRRVFMLEKLKQEEVEVWINELTQNDVDAIIDGEQYRIMEQRLVEATRDPKLLQPASFMVVDCMYEIREFDDAANNPHLALEEKALRFIVDTNKDLSEFEMNIKELINDCKERKELFQILILLMLLRIRLSKIP